MTVYAPGTAETDPKKQNRAIQAAGAAIATNTTDIATANANIAALQTAGAGLTNSGGSLAVSLSKITASLGADVALNNTANYFDGPSVAQGTTGTWFASGTVTVGGDTGNAQYNAKLWDGTTIIASATINFVPTGEAYPITLSGVIASPAANIRISVKDVSSTTGKIKFNDSGNSKDSTITAIRIA